MASKSSGEVKGWLETGGRVGGRLNRLETERERSLHSQGGIRGNGCLPRPHDPERSERPTNSDEGKGPGRASEGGEGWSSGPAWIQRGADLQTSTGCTWARPVWPCGLMGTKLPLKASVAEGSEPRATASELPPDTPDVCRRGRGREVGLVRRTPDAATHQRSRGRAAKGRGRAAKGRGRSQRALPLAGPLPGSP